MMRVSLGLLLLWWWAWLAPDLALLLHDGGAVDPRLIAESWTPYRVDWLQGLTLSQLQWAHLGGLAVLLAYTLGLGTPVVRWLVPLMLVVVMHRSPWAWNGGDRLIRIWALTLALTPCGAAWSVDAWWRARSGRPAIGEVPVLGYRLVQLQLLVMYLWTGLDKLGDPAWLNGSAIYYAVSEANFSRAPWLFDPLLQGPAGWALSAVLVAFTLIFEIGFVPLVLHPRTRKATLAAGAALHAGIFATMSVGMFGPASVWGYQAFAFDPTLRGARDDEKMGRASG
jgi:hypothetical protein